MSVHDFEVCIDRAVATLLGLLLGLRLRRAISRLRPRRRSLLVQRSRRLMPRLLQILGRRGDDRGVLALQRRLHGLDLGLDLALQARLDTDSAHAAKLRQQKHGLMQDLLTGLVRVKVAEPASR